MFCIKYTSTVDMYMYTGLVSDLTLCRLKVSQMKTHHPMTNH